MMRSESLTSLWGRVWSLIWRVVPFSIIAVAVSYILGKQVVQPHHRVIKAGLLFLVLVILVRFEMVYSIYFFILMFPFPSGLVLTSTNVILMTMIPLIWFARSRAVGERFFARTEIDRWIIVLIFAYFVSFFNVETTELFVGGLKMVWRQLAALAFFYLIVTFVNDEKQLERITKVVAISGGVVALTGLVELISPGATLIPGWIQTPQRMGQGELGYRVQGIRLGGAVGSHEILSDYSGLCLWFVVTHFLRAKNPIEKLLWMGISGVSLISILATANRGAVVAIGVAFLYSLWVFRRKLNLVKYVILISAVTVMFAAAQLVLDKYTVAASVTDRLTGTQFEGFTPDSRVGVWGPVFQSCLDHIFIGHGPWYDTGRGLVRVYWPHNGFLYYLHTLGLFGLAAFVVILFKVYRISLRYNRPAASSGFVGVALSVTSVQLAQLVVAQMRTDHQRTTDSIYMFIVWLVLGLVAASGNVLRRKEEESAADAFTGEADVPPSSAGTHGNLDGGFPR